MLDRPAREAYAYDGQFDAAKANTADARLKRTTPIGVFPEGDTPDGISDYQIWSTPSRSHRRARTFTGSRATPTPTVCPIHNEHSRKPPWLNGGLDTPRVHAILAASYIAFGDRPAATVHIKRHFDLVTTEVALAPPMLAGDSQAVAIAAGAGGRDSDSGRRR